MDDQPKRTQYQVKMNKDQHAANVEGAAQTGQLLGTKMSIAGAIDVWRNYYFNNQPVVAPPATIPDGDILE